MLSFLFSKIGAYLVGGVLIAGLVGGGILYVKHLYDQNHELKQANEQLEKDKAKLTEVMKNDLKTDARTEARKEAVDKLPVDQLINEWDRLRKYGSDSDDNSSSE